MKYIPHQEKEYNVNTISTAVQDQLHASGNYSHAIPSESNVADKPL